MVMSSSGFRRIVDRAPATIQAGRAQYLTSPPIVGGEEPTGAHVFAEHAARAFDSEAKTGLIELDLGEQMGVEHSATTANLLARYLVVREGDEFEFNVKASSVLCYVMKGSGRSFQEDEVIEWKQGDIFLLPGGTTILNEAPDGDAVMFVVTDEPLLAMLGSTTLPFDETQVMSTHFTARTINAKLEDLGSTGGAGMTKLDMRLASSQFEERGCVAPAIGAGVITLETGADQGINCCDVDTIMIAHECQGVHTMVGDERVAWVPNSAVLTPAGVEQSLHNSGGRKLFCIYIQDCGPRSMRTWKPRVSSELTFEGLDIPV